MDVVLVSCLEMPEQDVDQAVLLDGLRARGLSTDVWAWDDPSRNWAEPRLAVIRSTWNYHHDLPAFLAWVDRAGAATTVLNSPALVRANAHKQYLRTLAGAHVPVVPTMWFAREETPPLRKLLAHQGWDRVVVKPAVSAGSWMTALFEADMHAGAELRAHELLRSRDVMVQPYVASVEEYGERSLVWINGSLSHAVRKARRLEADTESVSRTAVDIADDERALALMALETSLEQHGRGLCVQDLLYARIDIARDESGVPMLMELELIEPSLFLLQAPMALDALVSAIQSHAQ